MPNNEPILTIGIPTWNRAKELQECVKLWAVQIEQTTEDIEVFVCDNASDDGTMALLYDLAAQYRFLRYWRNESNIGADRNFIEVLERSTGKYVWLFSDDDFLADGALAEILRIVKKHEPSHISTNVYSYDCSKGIVRNPDPKHMVSEDIFNADINTVFLRRNSWLSFMTCNIYRRDLLDYDDYKSHVGRVKNWVQVYMTAHILAHGKQGCLSSCYAVHGRDRPHRYAANVIVADLPEVFSYVLIKFQADDDVRTQVLREMRSLILPFKSFIRCRAFNIEPSPLLMRWYYKIAYLIPRMMLLKMWRAMERLSGRADRPQEG